MSAKDYEVVLCKDGHLYINKIDDSRDTRSEDSKMLSDDDMAQILVWYNKHYISDKEDLEEAARADAKFERSDDTEVGYDTNRYVGFIAGAEWREQKDKKAFELLKEWFEEIAEKCDRLTSGNVSHNGKMIRGFLRNCAEYIKTDLL